MTFQETAKMYKSDTDYNDFRYFYSAHTVDPNNSDNDYNGFLAFISTFRFGLAAQVTKFIKIFQCFFFRTYRASKS